MTGKVIENMSKKIIIRADDVGYTPVNNIGAFESIENGVVTAADVMLECPGTVDALERLKEMPWISVGWHTHFWGSPVCDPEKVPTLYNSSTGHFRQDLRNAQDVSEEEAYLEIMTQFERCEKILGRLPDVAGDVDPTSPFARAQIRALDGLKIPRNYVCKDGRFGHRDAEFFVDRRIYTLDGGVAYEELFTDSITEQEQKYDPYLYYAEDRGGMAEKFAAGFEVVTQSWHPGYVDYYMYQLGDQGPFRSRFGIIRTKDVEALTSERMKNWIKENDIELVNFRDALYGTASYQNHLRFTGSDLYAGNK